MNKKRNRGRPVSENPMVRTAVALPRDLLERLQRDAERADRGISTEIRQRLQWTYDLQQLPRDQETYALAERIKVLAANVAGELGTAWYENAYALEAFKAGVSLFLAQFAPGGDAAKRPDTRLVGEADDPPDTVGRTHARLILVAEGRSEKE